MVVFGRLEAEVVIEIKTSNLLSSNLFTCTPVENRAANLYDGKWLMVNILIRAEGSIPKPRVLEELLLGF